MKTNVFDEACSEAFIRTLTEKQFKFQHAVDYVYDKINKEIQQEIFERVQNELQRQDCN